MTINDWCRQKSYHDGENLFVVANVPMMSN
jgi:hypothetical protein